MRSLSHPSFIRNLPEADGGLSYLLINDVLELSLFLGLIISISVLMSTIYPHRSAADVFTKTGYRSHNRGCNQANYTTQQNNHYRFDNRSQSVNHSINLFFVKISDLD